MDGYDRQVGGCHAGKKELTRVSAESRLRHTYFNNIYNQLIRQPTIRKPLGNRALVAIFLESIPLVAPSCVISLMAILRV